MHIVAGMARDRDQALLCMVRVLAMTAPRPHMAPTVTFDYFYEIADFHGDPVSSDGANRNRIVSCENT